VVPVLLLALAAALYPQLLAVVVVILTRPYPRPLLWACYLASLLVSVGSSVALFVIFRSRGTVAGVSSHRVGPAAYLSIGAIALILATLMATARGRGLLARRRPALPNPRMARGAAAIAKTRARAEHALGQGSLLVACVVGALLALPGPFDLLALGRLARDGYALVTAGATMLVFALVKFALIEAPIASYALDPDGTAARVSRFSGWMQDNKLAGAAGIVGLIGILLIVRGITGLS
jgi:Sap, sulfolipid-1-addressing protein